MEQDDYPNSSNKKLEAEADRLQVLIAVLLVFVIFYIVAHFV